VLKRPDRDGDVVENAKRFAVVGERVVRAAGEIHRDPFVERCARRLARPADRAVRPLDERFGPRESEPTQLGRAEPALGEARHVLIRVHPPEGVQVRPGWLVHPACRHETGGQDPLSEKLVLPDREPVTRR
jgi:hypothetical protein